MSQKVIIDFEAKYKKAEGEITSLNKKVVGLEKAVDKSNVAAKKTSQNFDEMGGLADKATGGAISGFKGVMGTLKGVTTSLKTVKGALVATGFGAIAVIVGSLVAAFTSTEEGANKLSKIMGQIGVVVGNVTDILAEFGNGLMNMGSSISAVLRGDFAGAFDAMGEAFSGFTDKVSNFSEETKKELKIAEEISDMLAAAAQTERELKVERAQADQDRARLLDQAVDKERYTAQQRISFLQQASAIDTEITNKEILLAEQRLKAKQLENSLSGSVAEDKAAEAELTATLISLETARLAKQKAVTAQILGANREAAAARKAELDEQKAFTDKIAADDAAREKANEEKKLKDAEKKIADDKILMDTDLANKADAARREVEITQFLADAKAKIRDAEINNIGAGFALIGQLAGKNKALQATALIGESAVGIAKIVMQTNAANAAVVTKYALIPGGPAFAAAEITANKIGAGIGIASTIAATAKGLGALKAGGSAPQGANIAGPRGAVAAPAPTEPDFNVVGSSGTNQLAQAIGGKSNQPIKAFVVSSDVSTSQELDRNIVQGASL